MVVADSPQQERIHVLVPETTLLPPPSALLWECVQHPDLGWVVMAVDTKVQYPTFILSLSKEHQHPEAAQAVCEALARIYNAQDRQIS